MLPAVPDAHLLNRGPIEVVAWQKKLISLIIWTIAVKCWNGMRLNLIFGLMLDSHLVLIAAYSFTNCSTIVPPITPPPGLLTIIIYEFAFQLQPRNPSFSSSGKSPSVAGSSRGHMCHCGWWWRWQKGRLPPLGDRGNPDRWELGNRKIRWGPCSE